MNTGIRMVMAARLVTLAAAAAVVACTTGLWAVHALTPEQAPVLQEGPSAPVDAQDGLRVDVTDRGLLVTVAISVDVAISLVLTIRLIKEGRGNAVGRSRPGAAPDTDTAWTVRLAGTLNRDVQERDRTACCGETQRLERTTAAVGFAAAPQRGTECQEG